MSEDRFKEIFRRITAETPDAPAFSDLETHRATPAAPIRLRPWMAAVGAAALVLVVVGAFGLLGGGGPDLAAPDENTVDYVKLEYSATVNPVCAGGEIIDNGGFDEATIEIWGPNSDDLTLMVATFPDGSTERMMIEGEHLQPAHVWSSVRNTPFQIDGQSKFRTVQCNVGGSGGVLVAPPYSATGLLPLAYLGIPTEPGWWVEGIESEHVTTDEYKGTEALQIRFEHDRGIGVTTDGTEVDETYFDADDPMKFLASVLMGESPSLGTWKMEVAWVESASVPESSVSFSTDDFPYQMEGEPNPVTTTTVPSTNCPVTIPGQGFTPPADYPATPSDPNSVWYGDDQLWTVLSNNGSYYGPRKSVWWSVNFTDPGVEPEPDISVTWTLRDRVPITITNDRATNGSTSEDGLFMIAEADPDFTGCWEVTAIYKGASLTYVYYNPEGFEASLGTVPDVVGMTVNEARSIFETLAYRFAFHDSANPTYEVCAQEPGAGLEIDPGEIIGMRTAPPGGCGELMGSTKPPDGCASAEPQPGQIVVFFHCGDSEFPQPQAVVRYGIPGVDPKAAVFVRLVAGPTDEEEESGFASFFGPATANAVVFTDLQQDHLVVNFTQKILVDNANTATGSTFFLAELYANAFQFEEVESVEFQINGSCEAFWEFLQAGPTCNITDRAGWEQMQENW